MAHLHPLTDTDPHFTIDPATRTIKNTASTKKTIVQYDHNSECITFAMPRFVDGHDMTTCNQVEIHWKNLSSNKKSANSGIYKISDLSGNISEGSEVRCSWLIDQSATKYDGSLIFQMRFACVTGDTPDYVWNTRQCSEIVVDPSLVVSDSSDEGGADSDSSTLDKATLDNLILG